MVEKPDKKLFPSVETYHLLSDITPSQGLDVNFAPYQPAAYVQFSMDTRRALNRLKMTLRGPQEADITPEFTFNTNSHVELSGLRIADHTPTGVSTILKVADLLGELPRNHVKVTAEKLCGSLATVVGSQHR